MMMLSDEKRTLLQTKGIVVGRVLMGLLFFGSGVSMLLMGPANAASYFASEGIPLAFLVAILVIVLKIGAGGALLLGKHVGAAAAALILFTLGATFIAHMDMNDPGLFKNLAIIGGLLYVMAFGAGQWNTAPAAAAPTNDPLPE